MDLSTALVLMVVLLFCTAFASCSEMALASVSRIRIKAKADNGDKKAIQILELITNSERTITSIVVLNNIVNILLPTISTIVFIQIAPQYGVFISTIVMTIVIILFGEIVPKVYGRENAEKYLYRTVTSVNLIINLIYPISIVFIKISGFINQILAKDDEEDEDLVEVEEEILTMIEESSQEGKIDESEEELIRNAIEFNDKRVEEILQPKRNMVMVNVEDKNEDIIELMINERYSRIPVYEEDSDHIIGILYEREFLTAYIANHNVNIRSILRKPLFIPDTQKISKLLPELQQSKSHLAIVLDERATVQGLVTVEDILEELVGEIWDEHDEVVTECRKISDHEYEVSGEMTIGDFNELFEIQDVESDSSESTIAGYVIELAERIPNQGDVFFDDDFEFKITEISGNKVEKIKVKLLQIGEIEQ